MLVIAMAAIAANLESCKVEDAVYQQRSAPSITVAFTPVEYMPDWPSGLAMKMHFGETGGTYWWLPWTGGSNGSQNLASTTDVTAPGWLAPSADTPVKRPLGDVSYMGMDAQYNIIHAIPMRGATAPAHFHVPELRLALWYRTAPDKRDADSGQFFDLVSCASNAKDKAR